MIFKSTGSLLVGRTTEELDMLKRRVKQLSEAGLQVECLYSSDLLLEEPELAVGEDGGAAFVPDDCQIDAQRTASFIEKVSYFSVICNQLAFFRFFSALNYLPFLWSVIEIGKYG